MAPLWQLVLQQAQLSEWHICLGFFLQQIIKILVKQEMLFTLSPQTWDQVNLKNHCTETKLPNMKPALEKKLKKKHSLHRISHLFVVSFDTFDFRETFWPNVRTICRFKTRTNLSWKPPVSKNTESRWTLAAFWTNRNPSRLGLSGASYTRKRETTLIESNTCNDIYINHSLTEKVPLFHNRVSPPPSPVFFIRQIHPNG